MSPLTNLKKQALKVDPILTPAVRGVLEAVVADAVGGPEKVDPQILKTTTDRMMERLGLMPTFLGVPMAGATVVFDAMGILYAGRPFRSQPTPSRHKQMESWRNAPIGFLRNYLDFWEKMGVFVYFSTLEEKESHR